MGLKKGKSGRVEEELARHTEEVIFKICTTHASPKITNNQRKKNQQKEKRRNRRNNEETESSRELNMQLVRMAIECQKRQHRQIASWPSVAVAVDASSGVAVDAGRAIEQLNNLLFFFAFLAGAVARR